MPYKQLWLLLCKNARCTKYIYKLGIKYIFIIKLKHITYIIIYSYNNDF